jgi:hypothetical protein
MKRLKDVVIPGRDYPAKVGIAEVLDHEVILTKFDHVVIVKVVELEDGSKAEAIDADYYNVVVEDGETIKTFSTGATQIVNVLEKLAAMQKADESPLPCIVTFRKEGRVYLIE